MSRSLWVEGTKWFCKSINSVFSNIKSKSQSSTTGHIPHSRASLLFLHMKPRLNHELVCTHPFLAHRKIRKGKNLICSVFTTIVHFEEETTGQLYFHLALGFTYETERLFWDHELFWMFSWPELGFFFFLVFTFPPGSVAHGLFVKSTPPLKCFELPGTLLSSPSPLNCFPALPQDYSLLWDDF